MIDLLSKNHLISSDRTYSDKELITVMQDAYDSDFVFNCDDIQASTADILEYYEFVL